ncbi:MAG: hypothetical protein VX072_09570 [Pseudomonadota bacterium]|nr:hypothetical protein [Pseudomonadota bacterium]
MHLLDGPGAQTCANFGDFVSDDPDIDGIGNTSLVRLNDPHVLKDHLAHVFTFPDMTFA